MCKSGNASVSVRPCRKGLRMHGAAAIGNSVRFGGGASFWVRPNPLVNIRSGTIYIEDQVPSRPGPSRHPAAVIHRGNYQGRERPRAAVIRGKGKATGDHRRGEALLRSQRATITRPSGPRSPARVLAAKDEHGGQVVSMGSMFADLCSTL